MKFTRRDLLVWGAGAAAGFMVTPVPWKLLDDVSIWSQNWGWIPQPARGPVEAKQSFCTLCPNGCGLRVKMASGWPVGVAGMSTHPVSRGALCPLGFGAHQLNWHPQRVRAVRHRGTASSWNEAQASLKRAIGEGPVVIVDGYPGRAASSVFDNFSQNHGGSYRVVAGAELRALRPYETWTQVPATCLGYDLENSETILSFGAPLLDGWGTPGRVTRIWAERAASSNDLPLRLIQVEQALSRTAAKAWKWIQIREGEDTALASGLARMLIEQKLVPARGPLPLMTLAEAAGRTGLPEDAIRDLARMLVARPALAISRDENPAVAALNVVLGSVGKRGGIVRRSRSNSPYVAAEASIPNARAVLIDSSVPWHWVPQTDAEVFRLAAWDGGPTKADWLLPAPGFLEDLTDVPGAPTSSVETYAVAPSLVKAPFEVQSAAQLLASVDSSVPPIDKVIHSRCEDFWRRKSGTLHGKETTSTTQYETVQKFEEELRKGAVWVGEPAGGTLRCTLEEWPAADMADQGENWAAAWPAPVLPPLASKLYIESGLREAPERSNA
jgi:hypothetical protein